MFTRRKLLKGSLFAGASALLHGQSLAAPATTENMAAPPIDRKAVFGRHNVIRSKSKPHSPLQVGNGTIAFGADVTGLQTFVPFNILSDWGWYTAPLPQGQTLNDMADAVWPQIRSKKFSALTEEEHLRIVEREGNLERKLYYQML